MRGQSLAIVSNKIEAKRALEILSGEKDSTVIAISLEAEFYLKQKLSSWQNPLYDFVLSPRFRSKDYVFSNFNLASDFCNDKYLQNFKIRLGYFLAELERSLDLAIVILQKYRPKLLLIGDVKNYPGTSVVDGTLKTNAMWLLARELKIPYRLIGDTGKSFSLRQAVGKKIQTLRYLGRQKLNRECDLLILATPSHLLRMAQLIGEIKTSNISVRLLTYNVTVALKKLLDKNFSDYLEKERLLDANLVGKAEKARRMLIQNMVWKKFNPTKYRKSSEVLNYIRWKISDIIKDEALEVSRDLFLANEVLTKLRPKALVVTTDPDSKVLPYINRAREMGIKTVCLQHGAFWGNESPAIYPTSDFFVTWSDMTKKLLSYDDYFKKVMMVVGKSPFHNRVNSSKIPRKSKTATILILVTKHPTVEKGLLMFYQKKLFEILSKLEVNFKLIVRVHPFQDLSNINSLLQNFSYNARFENEKPLAEVLAMSDLVIFENTTAGLDAMLEGKPTVYFNPYNGRDVFNVGGNWASVTVLNLSALEKLPTVINNRKRLDLLAKNGIKYAASYLGIAASKPKLSDVIFKIVNGLQ